MPATQRSAPFYFECPGLREVLAGPYRACMTKQRTVLVHSWTSSVHYPLIVRSGRLTFSLMELHLLCTLRSVASPFSFGLQDWGWPVKGALRDQATRQCIASAEDGVDSLCKASRGVLVHYCKRSGEASSPSPSLQASQAKQRPSHGHTSIVTGQPCSTQAETSQHECGVTCSNSKKVSGLCQ